MRTPITQTQAYRSQRAMLKCKPGESQQAMKNAAVMTHDEIARRLGVTRQCVQMTERRALWKIRRALETYRSESGL